MGATRRRFLRLGALTLGGLTLGNVRRLRADKPSSNQPRPKSVIMIFMCGGPSHIDIYDLKPGAPSEYRGEFRPIDWDTHRYKFKTLRQLLLPLDQALSALILDLETRGLLEDVAVVMGAEFGRRLRIGDVL